jgi:hypothetical protein
MSGDDWFEKYEEAQREIGELKSLVLSHKAARIAYANEFDGDVGSIHQNIRKLKSENILMRLNLDRYEGKFL